jgi:leucyl aminopeptidase
MRVTVVTDGAAIRAAVAPARIVLGAWSTKAGPLLGGAAAVVESTLGIDAEKLAGEDPGFQAKPGQLLKIVVVGQDRERHTLLLVGLGARQKLSADVLRDASMVATAASEGLSITTTLALEMDGSPEAIRAVVEGSNLGNYGYRAVPASSAAELRVLAGEHVSPRDADAAVALGELGADASNWVRRLVETPGNVLGPAEFAAAIVRHVEDVAPGAVEVTVWSHDELVARGFGGTVAVGSGSVRHPRVVELRTAGAHGTIALAGKGITFDAGGINLKRDMSELAWMKSDMAGAASVAAAVIAVAGLGLGIGMHAVLPIAENLPGGSAVRPGDVLVHPGGRTTEVIDTDCEGRLVLADAIAYLAQAAPDAIIDVGTLTDSGALGTAFWGCWSTDPALGASLVDAGAASGEPGWLLPLHDSYYELLASPVADSANMPLDAPDSGQIAATYLAPFAAEVPWIHIDNGSGAYLERDVTPWPKGATGSPTRALIEYLRRSGSA